MANPIIKIKRSSVEGKQPGVADLPLGELALNTYDGRLYVSKSTDSGVTTSIVNVSGIQVQDEGTIVGYANTLNFVGTGVTVLSFSNGVGIVSITSGGGGGGGASISTTAPSSPTEGDLWYNSNLGRTFVYYDDGSSQQWVDVAPFNQGGSNSTVIVSSSAPTSPAEGQLWYNTILARTFIYYGDGSSSQWVDSAPFNTQTINRTLTIGTRTTASSLTLVGTGLTISLRSGIGTASF